MHQTEPPKPRILYVVREPWPTYRSDVRILFGKYLPRLGLNCDLVTEGAGSDHTELAKWSGGKAFLWGGTRTGALYHVGKFLHTARILIFHGTRDYKAVQVRDMPFHALFALIVARIRRQAFFYWMSFPMPESHVLRARTRGWRAGTKYWFPLTQGLIGKAVLYKLVLPRATHVFVQSQRMQDDLVQLGIDQRLITPVPMGVDLEDQPLTNSDFARDARPNGKKVLAYLGTLDRERNIEKLFAMLALVVKVEPRAVLLLIGSTSDPGYLKSLRLYAEHCGIAESVVWTGWLSMHEAWQHLRAADVGLSPIPRGPLLDVGSPTKTVEYMALGLPVVVNDNPDQQHIVRESGAGFSVDYEPEAFAEAVLQLLSDPDLRAQMGRKGQAYVREHRSYLCIATMLANKYDALLRQD
jgi:glycosyltransferase involved in cell wall biosynthesis